MLEGKHMTKPTQFEKSLTDLENIVEQLEKGELTLEASLQQYEKGIGLVNQCEKALSQAEQKIETLSKSKPSSGNPTDE
jgi:exodeoxyribonuclease VII small subunit